MFSAWSIRYRTSEHLLLTSSRNLSPFSPLCALPQFSAWSLSHDLASAHDDDDDDDDLPLTSFLWRRPILRPLNFNVTFSGTRWAEKWSLLWHLIFLCGVNLAKIFGLPILALFCYWVIFICFKWQNIEQIVYPSGHTGYIWDLLQKQKTNCRVSLC